MATATRKHSIVNPAPRRHKRKKNRARAKHRKRNLSKAQIRAGFGGKRRMKAKRRRNAGRFSAGSKKGSGSFSKKLKKLHRKGKSAQAAYLAKKRKQRIDSEGGSVWNPRRKKSHRRVARRSAPKRRTNPGEILSLTLGNPGGKRRGMAKRRKKNAHHHRKHAVARRRRNPGRRHVRHIRHRRNPGVSGIMGLLTQGVFAAGGLVASRFVTQAVLGAQNTGFMGYAGNAVATGLLAWGTHVVSKNPRNRDAVILGGVMGIIARLITDFTPYGSFLQQQGFGDYGMGLYLQQNDPMPSRLVAPNGAIVEIPSPGWAPTVMAPAATGMGDLYGGGDGLYG